MPEIDICSYSIEEGISLAFDPNRALLRSVFFLDENRTRYVSVAFYPSMSYMPMVEFGGSKIGPIRLSAQQVMALVEHLPRLCDARCTNAHYTSGTHDRFGISTTTHRTARMHLSQGTRITFKLPDLRYLNTIMPIVRSTSEIHQRYDGRHDMQCLPWFPPNISNHYPRTARIFTTCSCMKN